MNMPPVQYSVTRLGGGTTNGGVSFPGGLDLTTPSLALQPGALRNVVNFECSQAGGYARIKGYERLDGRPSPHNGVFSIVQVNSFTNVPSNGQTITQAGSGATGVIITVNNVSGAYYMVVTKVTGTLNNSGAVTVGATAIGTTIVQTVQLNTLQIAQYNALAADNYRADIGAVPGSGSVLGVVGMNFNNVDQVYAFRASADGTVVNVYAASSSGWTLVPMLKIVSFTAGTEPSGGGTNYDPADGQVLTQGGVTATAKRIMWQSGSFGGVTGTAVGDMVITTPAGGNFAAGNATLADGTVVHLSGVQTQITLVPGLRFQFEKANFGGQLASRRIYGCDGTNKAFEFDGTTLAPIKTGNVPDAPSNICAHKEFLFLSQNSSLFYSGVGTPFKWGAVDGGGEIATGDTVAGLVTLPGSQTTATLGVFLRSNTAFLYGTDPTTFNYTTFNTGTGALQYTTQNLSDTFVLDDLGVITLKTTLNYGNFLPSTLTKNILPFIEQERSRACASSLNRAKSQYRIWFNDGFGLWITSINSTYLGSSVVFFPNPVLCADETDLAGGGMASYFGSNNGFVYQLDVGTSFDGGNIDAYITTVWDPIKSPRILKRFRAASIEMQGGSYAAINFGYQLGYGTPLIGQPANVNAESGFSGVPLWDSFVWDAFTWDGQTLFPSDVSITGTGENIQFTIR
jgi:hypothetical protein